MASTTGPVLVTGGSGYIALELISQLLVRGYTVHTTVRSLQSNTKVQPLRNLKERHPQAKLLLFEADLLQPGSFRPAMQDFGAIAGDYIDVINKMNRVMSHEYFNETSTVEHNPYHYSKVLAEKEAWKFYHHQSPEQRRWDLVVICSALVLGPTLTTSSESGSLFLMDELLSGWMFYGVPDLSFLPVDIRDVAAAHIKAAELKGANGRYIVGPPETTTFLEISKHFKKLKNGSILIPNFQLPTSLVKIVGPLFGLSQKWMACNLGVRFAVDNTRSISELGVNYRPLEETLDDHFASWAKPKDKEKSKTI
ncbi:Bifunctional dihydroflavonol 4-reductase/flavanone 4-reductase [Cytospora mali]|uniref:Bifunctional dihydroflavonol 4-reductase/flavanone 4-reductase n=1 Tax=Cytospora mali TaxID=578113 RepID=A0A194V1P9_CYTMA|nr:Bifunctional dihydroflavonol 4-reductase/flavanone 4-reductase [Valsa mali var. pyri (nom. inval.)]